MSGVMDRFPKLKLLWSHGGGTWPYLAGRFDVMHKRMDKAQQGNVAAKTPSAYATQMTYDSIVHAPKALRFLIDIAGIGNVLLGTDYSFPPADMEPLAMLKSRRPLEIRQRRDLRRQPAPPVRADEIISPSAQQGIPRSGRMSGCSAYIITRSSWPADRCKELQQYAAVTKNRHKQCHAASRYKVLRLARRVALRYHSTAITDGDRKGQSGRQETDGRSTSQSECLPGAQAGGERVRRRNVS